jgi:hypothetical protein
MGCTGVYSFAGDGHVSVSRLYTYVALPGTEDSADADIRTTNYTSRSPD